MHWFLEPSAFQALQHARRMVPVAPTSEWNAWQAAEGARSQGADGQLPRCMSIWCPPTARPSPRMCVCYLASPAW